MTRGRRQLLTTTIMYKSCFKSFFPLAAALLLLSSCGKDALPNPGLGSSGGNSSGSNQTTTDLTTF